MGRPGLRLFKNFDRLPAEFFLPVPIWGKGIRENVFYRRLGLVLSIVRPLPLVSPR